MPTGPRRTAPRRPRRNPAQPPDPEQVASRAYFLWLDDPEANPDPVANWLRAEAELSASSRPSRPRQATKRRPGA